MDISLKKERVHSLVDALPLDCLDLVSEFIQKLIMDNGTSQMDDTQITGEQLFERMEKMRREMRQYSWDDIDSERTKAIEEKYGKFDDFN